MPDTILDDLNDLFKPTWPQKEALSHFINEEIETQAPLLQNFLQTFPFVLDNLFEQIGNRLC